MRLLAGIRNIVGVALLMSGWALVVYGCGAYSGQVWIVDTFARYLIPGWLLMIPLGLLYALLALPGGVPWERRLKRAMVMKLLLVPFFVVNFWMGIAGAVVFFLGGLILTVLALFTAWFTLIATSADTILALTDMRREGQLTTGKMVKHIIFQLIYCVDVIDTVVLWRNRDSCAPEA